jgi:hypothetical protein
MSTLRTNTLSNAAGSASVPVDTVISGSAKAWVNFNGTFGSSPFTIANGGIRAAFNVSSVTDNGTGDYTVNFATAMPDANYSWASISGSPGVTNGVTIATTPTASALPLVTVNTAFNLYDPVFVTCAVFR